MKLSREDVTHIAQLARLNLTDDEVERYRSQLSEVLTYIDQLNEVDTANVPITAQVTGVTNVLADDQVHDSGVTREDLLANAPDQHGGQIKVRAVFDRGGA